MNTDSKIVRACELKRIYRRNLLLGFGLAGSLHLLAIGALAILTAFYSNKPIEAKTVTIKNRTDIMQPPRIRDDEKHIKVATPEGKIPPVLGDPVPAPDSEVVDGIKPASQKELADMVPENPVTNLDDINIEVDINGIIEELLPGPDEFVPRDEEPVEINHVSPIYPALAQRAGMEGTVWLRALVDKEGRVRDVDIVNSTNNNAGFEEAAIEAAYKTNWKPAIANGQPVAVWVTYRVDFVLR